MTGEDNFQLVIKAPTKMVQDGTIIPILRPKMRVVVSGLVTVLYVREGEVVAKTHDENFDLEKGTAMATLKHCGFKRFTMRKLMEDVKMQDMEGITDRYYCKN